MTTDFKKKQRTRRLKTGALVSNWLSSAGGQLASPMELKFDLLPVGYALESAKPGMEFAVRTMEFVSSEDGNKFIQALEAATDFIVQRLDLRFKYCPSLIHNMLAVVRRDMSATVFVNNAPARTKMQVMRGVKSGEGVFLDDIADVGRLSFEGVNIPDDAGVVYFFTVGWRRGLFFDFGPLNVKRCSARNFDLSLLLGRCYADLLFQDIFRITDAEWQELFRQQWFPFRRLKTTTIKAVLGHIRSGWAVDELLPKITNEVRETLRSTLDGLKLVPELEGHILLLEKAAEHYVNGDFVSAVGLIYPRIEGILRSHYSATGTSGTRNQSSLASTAVSSGANERHDRSFLLPQRFEEFLLKVYFAGFDPSADPTVDLVEVSRNSIGHGIASISQFNEKAATIGFLIIQQLNYFVRSGRH